MKSYLLACVVILYGLLSACKEKQQADTSGGSDKGDETALARIKSGMTLSEVEKFLGKGTETPRPEGKGLPHGAFVTEGSEGKMISNTCWKWQIGPKTIIVSFFRDHVSTMQDGSVALVEMGPSGEGGGPSKSAPPASGKTP